MDVFTGNEPDLVNNSLFQDVETNYDIKFGKNKFGTLMRFMYENYVQPNMFPIIVILFLCIYLLIKYLLKKNYPTSQNIKQSNIPQLLNNVPEIINDDIASFISDDYLLTDTNDIAMCPKLTKSNPNFNVMDNNVDLSPVANMLFK